MRENERAHGDALILEAVVPCGERVLQLEPKAVQAAELGMEIASEQAGQRQRWLGRQIRDRSGA